MSDREPAFVRCIILEEREISLHIQQDQARGGEVRCWIPRSQIDHISKKGKNAKGDMEAEIEMTEWIAEQKGLDYK